MSTPDKFDNYVAILRSPKSRASLMTKWSNVPALRRIRNNHNQFKGGKILRKKIDEGIESIANIPSLKSDTIGFDYYPDLRFLLWYANERSRLNLIFTSIDNWVYEQTSYSNYKQVTSVLPYFFPSWFLNFIKEQYPLVNIEVFYSEYSFNCEFCGKYSQYFFDLEETKTFFYQRYEQQLANTLEPEVILNIADYKAPQVPKNSSKKTVESFKAMKALKNVLHKEYDYYNKYAALNNPYSMSNSYITEDVTYNSQWGTPPIYIDSIPPTLTEGIL